MFWNVLKVRDIWTGCDGLPKYLRLIFVKIFYISKTRKDLLQTGTVDNNRMAVKELQDALQNRKINKVWSEILEQLIKKYVEVSVPLRKAQEIKTYLIQYKSACNFSNNAKALDNLIQHYIDLAEKRLALAISQMKNPNLDITTDADSEQFPESIFAAALADENPNRADRELVAPWMKFLWETYRTVLDVYRNSPADARYHVRFLKQFCCSCCLQQTLTSILFYYIIFVF